VLLLQTRMRCLERLKLGDLTRGTRRRYRWELADDPPLAHITAPLGQHEWVDLKRTGDGLHLHPGLLTQADGTELERIAVLPNGPWPSAWHR